MKPIVRVGVACFVWKGDKFFVQKRLGSHGEGTWSIPGGHLEFNETWGGCAKREVLEETGMEIEHVSFLAVTNDIFESENKHYITIWMEAGWKANEPRIMEPDRLTEIGWANFQTLPSPPFEPCWQNLRKAKPELF